MKDNYGRNINYLRLSITDLCNYRCIYCMDSEGVKKREHSDLLSIEELINISRIAVECGITKIRLTGGEPLVREGILQLCEGLKAINGLEELVLTTNGAKLSEMAKDLKAVGVDRINISLDTLNEDKFRKITRIGCLEDVLKGIKEAINAGFEDVKINVVLMAGINDDEIEKFIDFTKDNPVHVRFIELMPLGPCKEWYDERYISTDIITEKVPVLVPLKKDGVANVFKLKGAAGTVGLISPITNIFCSECNRLRITSDGRLLPCLHSDLEYIIRGLSNKELKEAFCTAIKNKPCSHNIVERHVSDNRDYMHKIGG